MPSCTGVRVLLHPRKKGKPSVDDFLKEFEYARCEKDGIVEVIVSKLLEKLGGIRQTKDMEKES